MTKSWTTSIGGILLAAGGFMATQMEGQVVKLIGGVVSAIGALLMGLAARDNDKSSEDAGTK